MDEPATIRVHGVSKHFGALRALHDIHLDVSSGEIVGLLGHNGAGKTTLLRIVNGLLQPDAGSARVLGIDPSTDGARVRALTGVLTEYPALDDYLSPAELLGFYARVHGVGPAESAPAIAELLDRFEVPQEMPCRELSAGLKQRVALARALVHDPPVLLLDEPTTNMDPIAARGVRELIATLSREHDRTVLLSTHNLAEAQQLCDRVAIVRRGEVLADGTPDALRTRLSSGLGARLTCVPQHLDALVAAVRPAAATIAVATIAVNGSSSVEVQGAVEVPDLVRRAVASGVDLLRVEPLEPTLEDVYVSLHADAGEKVAQ